MPIPDSFRARLRELAARGVFVGTSSWKYEGWVGQIYSEDRYMTRRKFSKKRFDERCLAEYAETFKTVSVDASFYTFPTPKYLERLASAVPADFRFGFKATGEVTLKHFPNLPQHGARAGKPNDHFLNAEMFAQRFLEPCRPFRGKVGLIMFEFTQFRKQDYGHGREFVADLDRFLGALPKDWTYAVEIRNRTFLQPEYFEVLRRHRVAHVFNQWTRMPEVGEQMRMDGSRTADFLAARFLLTCGRDYEDAVKEFSPYSETCAVDASGRAAGRALIAEAAEKGKRPSFIFVNNRFEGNSPNTIRAMVESKMEGHAASYAEATSAAKAEPSCPRDA